MDDRIDMTEFARDLRDAYLTSPSEATKARDIAAITDLARSLDHDSASVQISRRKSMLSSRPLARAAKAAACAASLVLATAGLAVAGVDLPAPAQDAFEKAGLSLPNQAGGGDGPSATSGRADEVHGVIDVWPPAERGCEFGHAVAVAARGSALPTQAQAACGNGEQGAANKNEAHGKSGEAHGNSANTAGRAFGEETAREAKGLDDATPEQRRQFGEDTAKDAQDLGGAPAAAPESSPAPPAAQGGPETGQTKSGAGQAIGDQASGGRKP
jgi:hypothetical protein